jgi:hypothetical protein
VQLSRFWIISTPAFSGAGLSAMNAGDGRFLIVSLSMILDGICHILISRYAMVYVLFPSPKLPRESVDSSGNKEV